MSIADLHILTGAPGTGKSAILNRLSSSTSVINEPAREILSEQRSTGGVATPERDPSLFVKLLLQRSIGKYRAARESGTEAIFDRGIPDCIAYAMVLGVDPRPSVLASRAHRYHPDVLILAPWEEIYTVVDERMLSLRGTTAFHTVLVRTYEELGYGLVDVPRASIEDRATFVRDFVRTSDSM